MPRHKKNITEEELMVFKEESERKRKISLARAKKKYQSSEKGKICSNKYYEKNKLSLVNKARENRAFSRDKLDMLQRFFMTYESQHPDFFPKIETCA